MKRARFRPDGEIVHTSLGWSASLFLHGSVFAAGLWLISALHMPQEPERFRWEVSLVSPQASVDTSAPRPLASPARRESPAPAHPRPLASGRIEEPAETVVRDIHEVQESVTAPQQPIQPTPPPPDRSVIASRPAPVIQPVEAPPQRPATPGETSTPVQPASETPKSQNPVPAVTEFARDAGPAPALAGRAEPPLSQTPVSVPDAPTEPSRAQVSETPAATPLPSPIQQASLPGPAFQVAPSIRPDYGWLNGMLVGRIRERQEYPSLARLRGVEGKVQVRIVIQKNGELGEASIVRSSGHLVLDEAALKTVRDAFPLPLDKPLDTPQLVRVIPISYTLD